MTNSGLLTLFVHKESMKKTNILDMCPIVLSQKPN